MGKMMVIDEQLLGVVLNYLASKPFNEVANLIRQIQQTVRVHEDSSVMENPAKMEGEKSL